MSKKISKNLQRVQDMIDGNYKNKIQTGYEGQVKKERKLGDIWTDDDGIKWEQKNGYKIKITKTANVGIFKAHCKDCNKGILKPWDKDAIEKEMINYIDELDKIKKEKIFDKKIANALSNVNIDDSIKINKKMLN